MVDHKALITEGGPAPYPGGRNVAQRCPEDSEQTQSSGFPPAVMLALDLGLCVQSPFCTGVCASVCIKVQNDRVQNISGQLNTWGSQLNKNSSICWDRSILPTPRGPSSGSQDPSRTSPYVSLHQGASLYPLKYFYNKPANVSMCFPELLEPLRLDPLYWA
jgi:hypothetical protein